MTLIELLRKESKKPLEKLLLFSALSGIASTGSLALINNAAQNTKSDSINISQVVMFLAVLGIFAFSFKYIIIEGINIIEDILNGIRLRISDKIRRTDLQNVESIGKATIYNCMTQELSMVSQMSIYLIQAMQSAVLLIFITIYVAILSKVAVVLVVILVTIGFFVLHKKDKIVLAKLQDTNKADIKYFMTLTDILDGLKEIKLNRKKSSDLFDVYGKISDNVKSLKIDVGHLFAQNIVFSQSFIFLTLGAIVFVLPQFQGTLSDDVLSTTTAMLFAIGPLGSLISTLPYYEKVNLSVKNIFNLEKELDMKVNYDEIQPQNDFNCFSGFKKIVVDNLYFEYLKGQKRDSFSVGPFNLELRRGETVFVIGGNGSGKTTMLKALTMLYKPNSGSIYVDDKLVDNTNFHDYRELYSAIFNDFHLFEKLYGIKGIGPEKVSELLKLMKIEGKTDFCDNGFTEINLSTGQRKRLALIVSILEDKPVYIFDEWAADQDPTFKDFFYDKLLKKLKAADKTVIAVSHDDRYFHLADRIIKLDYGKLIEGNS
jgi:putative ATP-binding cassette transporter